VSWLIVLLGWVELFGCALPPDPCRDGLCRWNGSRDRSLFCRGSLWLVPRHAPHDDVLSGRRRSDEIEDLLFCLFSADAVASMGSDMELAAVLDGPSRRQVLAENQSELLPSCMRFT